MLDRFLVIKETIEPFLQAPTLMHVYEIEMDEPICIFIEPYWP